MTNQEVIKAKKDEPFAFHIIEKDNDNNSGFNLSRKEMSYICTGTMNFADDYNKDLSYLESLLSVEKNIRSNLKRKDLNATKTENLLKKSKKSNRMFFKISQQNGVQNNNRFFSNKDSACTNELKTIEIKNFVVTKNRMTLKKKLHNISGNKSKIVIKKNGKKFLFPDRSKFSLKHSVNSNTTKHKMHVTCKPVFGEKAELSKKEKKTEVVNHTCILKNKISFGNCDKPVPMIKKEIKAYSEKMMEKGINILSSSKNIKMLSLSIDSDQLVHNNASYKTTGLKLADFNLKSIRPPNSSVTLQKSIQNSENKYDKEFGSNSSQTISVNKFWNGRKYSTDLKHNKLQNDKPVKQKLKTYSKKKEKKNYVTNTNSNGDIRVMKNINNIDIGKDKLTPDNSFTYNTQSGAIMLDGIFMNGCYKNISFPHPSVNESKFLKAHISVVKKNRSEKINKPTHQYNGHTLNGTKIRVTNLDCKRTATTLINENSSEISDPKKSIPKEKNRSLLQKINVEKIVTAFPFTEKIKNNFEENKLTKENMERKQENLIALHNFEVRDFCIRLGKNIVANFLSPKTNRQGRTSSASLASASQLTSSLEINSFKTKTNLKKQNKSMQPIGGRSSCKDFSSILENYAGQITKLNAEQNNKEHFSNVLINQVIRSNPCTDFGYKKQNQLRSSPKKNTKHAMLLLKSDFIPVQDSTKDKNHVNFFECLKEVSPKILSNIRVLSEYSINGKNKSNENVQTKNEAIDYEHIRASNSVANEISWTFGNALKLPVFELPSYIVMKTKIVNRKDLKTKITVSSSGTKHQLAKPKNIAAEVVIKNEREKFNSVCAQINTLLEDNANYLKFASGLERQTRMQAVLGDYALSIEDVTCALRFLKSYLLSVSYKRTIMGRGQRFIPIYDSQKKVIGFRKRTLHAKTFAPGNLRRMSKTSSETSFSATPSNQSLDLLPNINKINKSIEASPKTEAELIDPKVSELILPNISSGNVYVKNEDVG